MSGEEFFGRANSEFLTHNVIHETLSLCALSNRSGQEIELARESVGRGER